MGKTTADIRADFKQRLADPRIIVAPGVFDALSAWLSECAGFEAVFFSGSAASYSQLARPDIGMMTMPELADAVARAADRVSIPIIADVDSGFGATPHAARMMRSFERAGAAAVQIEDQAVVKPGDALTSRPLVSIDEMTDKIKALLDARQSDDMLVSARTDAKDPNEAIERCAAYRTAGADLIFAEGMTKAAEIKRLADTVDADTPLVYNTIYADGDAVDAAGLEALGLRVALFPGVALQNAAAGMIEGLKKLKADPSLTGGAKSPLSGPALLDILEAPEFLEAFEKTSS